MFFVLSKTIAVLLLPSNILILIGLVGLALLATRWRRAGRRLVISSFIMLVLAGVLPLGAVLNYALEQRFPPWDPARGAPDGIIVLGGAISPTLSRTYGATQVNDSAERVMIIPELARRYPNARIVYSGGDASLRGKAGREADYVYPLLDSLGVSRERVMLEDRSRNTYENAVFAKELVRPGPGERWLLVTSAFHMPRAVGCFRRAGFPVEAYPVDWRAGASLRFGLSRHIAASLNTLDAVTHEWFGLVAYWLRGRTSEFFPSPAAAH